jgi:hypothetical protein
MTEEDPPPMPVAISRESLKEEQRAIAAAVETLALLTFEARRAPDRPEGLSEAVRLLGQGARLLGEVLSDDTSPSRRKAIARLMRNGSDALDLRAGDDDRRFAVVSILHEFLEDTATPSGRSARVLPHGASAADPSTDWAYRPALFDRLRNLLRPFVANHALPAGVTDEQLRVALDAAQAKGGGARVPNGKWERINQFLLLLDLHSASPEALARFWQRKRQDRETTRRSRAKSPKRHRRKSPRTR